MEYAGKLKERVLVIYSDLDNSVDGQHQYQHRHNLLKRYELRYFYPCYGYSESMDITSVYNRLRQEICDFSPAQLLMLDDNTNPVNSRAFTKIIEKILSEFSHIKVIYQQKPNTQDELNNLGYVESPAFS